MSRFNPRLLAKKLILSSVGTLSRVASTLRPRRIAVYYAWPDFARKAEAIADLLRRRGLPAVVRSGTSFVRRAQVKSSADLWIGFWNKYPVAYLPRNYVFFNAEPLGVTDEWRDDADWFKAMRNALEVWDYFKPNEQYVTPLGVRFHFVPFGYAPYYEESFKQHTAGKTLSQDIDVLFVGHVSERRRVPLERMASLGLKVHMVTRANPLHGEGLDEVLARSKIVLGIHRFDEPELHAADYARLDHLLSNRRFVVHERLSENAADPAFERNVTTCSYDDLPEACRYFLERDSERARIAEGAYQWFKAERPLDIFLPYEQIRRYLEQR